MEKPIELNEFETAAVSGGLLNNIFVNLGNIDHSFATNSNNTNSNVANHFLSDNVWRSFNSFLSNNSI